jgi:hypothetical protein
MVDSTAAKAITSRSGLGKARNFEVRHLWVQDAVSRGRFVIKRVLGKFNPADVLTKPLGHDLDRGSSYHLESSLTRPWS